MTIHQKNGTSWLSRLYPMVQGVIREAGPKFWPEMGIILGDIAGREQILPEAILPLATCKAVGGNAENAVHIAAATVVAAAALRIFDDALDQDRAKGLWYRTGASRAWNYGTALEALSFNILRQAPLNSEQISQVSGHFIEAFCQIASGQDRDLLGVTKTIEDYWLTIEQKSAYGYQTGCLCGALVGTEHQDLIEACGTFGYHLGLALQILNDMESIWCPDGKTDLRQGKVTLPLIYGLNASHPEQEELKNIVENCTISNHGERIKQILDHIDTQSFLIWAALKEREQALDALAICPNPEGVDALKAYVTGLFGDIDSLLEAKASQETV